ncbi:MAG TPA: ATP-binding protein [Kofleriaceae bacterium]|nr:ATP-binding protein [Kofleriaceae bacterium]
MNFIDREDELARLIALSKRREGGLAVITGRRRVGKTRLLVEWIERSGGVYFVADQSSAEVQRRYLVAALSAKLRGLEGVTFADWRTLLAGVAERAIEARWTGPLVLDEIPYLVLQAPELPSVLQHFVDHDAKRARLSIAIAGSSQRLMQGLVMDASAPLFGRARELLVLAPLPPAYVRDALGNQDLLAAWTAWGGIPRYWELARDEYGPIPTRIDRLVLDPLGPLHREPDHILLEEVPSALEVRPVLDAIGAGVHRVSEIAGRMGRPATSLSRPLDRLVGMGLATREVPFGESGSKRALYRIADPFFRLWFRVVAPNRGPLATMSTAARRALLAKHWPGLLGEAWEQLCRDSVPRLGEWSSSSRWWRGNEQEWDVVAESIDRTKLLLGEVKLRASQHDLDNLVRRPLPTFAGTRSIVRVLFAAHTRGRLRSTGARLVGSREVFARS